MKQKVFQPTTEQEMVIGLEGSAFVTACPGAGKTRVMTERARHLFANIPPGRGVAFLSFTHAAISELETRLREEGILSCPVFPSFTGTFDSFIWQFLVAPFGITGCELRPRLIPDLDELPVIPYPKAQSLPLSCFCRSTGSMIQESAKRLGFNVSEKSSSQLRAYETKAAATRARQREAGHLSFEDARAVALERIDSIEIAGPIAAALSGRFWEVIVDEAQDCNIEDLRIISWLRRIGIPVKVICDPNQAIYKFRGGVTDELLEFGRSFREAECKNLTGNFRSTSDICKCIVMFRPDASRSNTDEALGWHKDAEVPVQVLSYPEKVSSRIGAAFRERLLERGIEPSKCPILAATRESSFAAAGHPKLGISGHRSVRLAEAVSSFQYAADPKGLKLALERVHEIVLELEGRLGTLSYGQYLSISEIESSSWRPLVLFLLRELRFDTTKYADAKAWHLAAKNLLATHVKLANGRSIAQEFAWNSTIPDVLAPLPTVTTPPLTIHSVKGMEFPAVCVVTTSTLKSILDYLETGKPSDRAEEARKLYVAASRAEQLLVIAAPKNQAKRLSSFLATGGVSVELTDI